MQPITRPGIRTRAALASALVLEGLVFGVSASDPVTLAAATLALVALPASLLPAWRAARSSFELVYS
jgi:ABC-type lipoprotein release transport system permease subunit